MFQHEAGRHSEKEWFGQQKLRPERSRRIIHDKKVHGVRCSLPVALLGFLDLRTANQGKYEEQDLGLGAEGSNLYSCGGDAKLPATGLCCGGSQPQVAVALPAVTAPQQQATHIEEGKCDPAANRICTGPCQRRLWQGDLERQTRSLLRIFRPRDPEDGDRSCSCSDVLQGRKWGSRHRASWHPIPRRALHEIRDSGLSRYHRPQWPGRPSSKGMTRRMSLDVAGCVDARSSLSHAASATTHDTHTHTHTYIHDNPPRRETCSAFLS